jgi:hypothetical protein
MGIAAGSDRRYGMCVAGRFTAQQRGIRRPPGNQCADGSLPGIRNRHLRPRTEMQLLPGTAFGQEPALVRV